MPNKFILVWFILASLLVGCSLATRSVAPATLPTATSTLKFLQPPTLPPDTPTSAPTLPPSATPISDEQTVLERAAEVVAALKEKDMVTLSHYVHPQSGLRYSPYAAVKDTDQVFSADKVTSLMADSTVYTWGAYFGTGEPIQLTFAEYYSKFIYDVDFANAPQLSLNHRLGVSTTLDNNQEFYPGAMIVEYHFPSFDPQYEGMDWRSLRLVFMQDNNTWYLAGIIHDQWTT